MPQDHGEDQLLELAPSDEPVRRPEEPRVGRRPRLTPREARRSLAVVVALTDLFVLTVATLLAYVVRVGLRGTLSVFSAEAALVLGLPFLWLVFLQRFGCYRPEYLNATGDAFRRYVQGVLAGVVAVGFLSFILHLNLSRTFVALIAGFALILGSLSRLWLRRVIGRDFRTGLLRQPLLIVGVDPEAAQLASAVLRSENSGYEVAGFLTDAADDGPAAPPEGGPILGTTEDLDRVIAEHRIGVVLVSPTAVGPGTLQTLMERLEGSDVGLAVAPSLFQVVTRRVTVESVANVPVLHVDQIRLDRFKAFQKRTLDIVGALLASVVALPVALITAIAVRVDSPGPILFRQERVGKDGRTFTLYKFRTMVADAEERLHEVAHLNEADGHFFKVQDDPRVTGIGGFLRKWSIDELPQLWNILRGDMSLVGTRPPVPREVVEYEPWHHRRLRIRPGLTGVWQTSGRSSVAFDEAVRMDVFYIENWSLGYDLFLLLKTVPTVLGRKGAY